MNAKSYQLDEEALDEQYINSIYRQILDLTCIEMLNKFETAIFYSSKKLVMRFASEVECEYLDRLHELGEDNYEHNVGLFSESGSCSLERIGYAISHLDIFPQHLPHLLSLISRSFTHEADLTESKDTFLKLFTYNRYESRKRLLKCRKVISGDVAGILSSKIIKYCREIKSMLSRVDANLLNRDFKAAFLSMRQPVHHMLHVISMIRIKGSAYVVQLRYRHGVKPIRFEKKYALIFLALLHDMITTPKNPFSTEIAAKLCEVVEIKVPVDSWKRRKWVSDSISHIERTIKKTGYLHIERMPDESFKLCKTDDLEITCEGLNCFHTRFTSLFHFRKPSGRQLAVKR